MVQGRLPLPTYIVEATGAIKEAKIAELRDVAPAIGDPIGGPPDYMTDVQASIWMELRGYMWWLRVHHAPLFEMYVRLIVQMRSGDTSSAVINGMMRCASALGGDPRSDQRFASPNRVKDEHFD